MMRRLFAFLLLGALVFVLAGLALLPMRVVLAAARLDRAGLSAGHVTGSVWGAKLSEARFRGAALGTLRLGLAPAALLTGSVQLQFSTQGAGEASGVGRLLLRAPGLAQVNATVPLSGFSTPIPLRGSLRFVGVSFRFAKGRCVGAAGRISTDALSASAASLGWQGPDLEGPVTCVGNAAIANLVGEREGVQVQARLALDAGGMLKLDSSAAGLDAAGQAALGAAGFVQGPDGWTRTDQGRL